MPIVCDLLIVGAGPAGSAAAIEARRAGLSVILIDKASFPRDKCCGDGLTAGALRHLEYLGLDPGLIPSWRSVQQVKVAGPARRLVTFPLPVGRGQFAAIARRRELDAALLDLARSAGARVDEQTPLQSIDTQHDRVRIQAGGREYEAAMVIAADGMWSPTRKLLGLGTDGYRGDWHGFRQYFRGVGPVAATELCVWFEPDLLPGYFWSFPLGDGAANVGFGILRNSGHKIQDMKTLWPDLLQRPHIREVLGPDAAPEGSHRALPIPARLPSTVLVDRRVIFVGDAARAADPMTGEGIGQALETGILAARSIAEAGAAAPERATASYVTALKKGMIKDHRLAGLLSRILGTRLGADASLKICSPTPWTRRNFVRWLFEDYPRAVLGTPGRWERGLFHRDGAYRTSPDEGSIGVE